jgi:hypothetical protein
MEWKKVERGVGGRELLFLKIESQQKSTKTGLKG